MTTGQLLRRASAPWSGAREAGVPSGTRLPLALLRAPTGSREAGADWKVEPDGVLGRVLEVLAGTTVSYPLRLEEPVTLTAGARAISP